MPFPWIAAAIAATAGASVWGAHSANRASRDSSREQMAFQERMSSTAHQRQMQDMQKAGLNPALAAKYGGASTPGGASFTAQNEMSGLPESVTTGLSVARFKLEKAQTLSQIEMNAASAEKIRAETRMLDVTRAKDLAIQPLYDEAGHLIKGSIQSAKSAASHAAKTVQDPRFWHSVKDHVVNPKKVFDYWKNWWNSK